MEKLKIYPHQKKFRQINNLVISFGKPLLSRNFCQKIVAWSEFLSFPHCARQVRFVWRNKKFSSFLHNFFSSNQFRVEFFSENVDFTEFLRQNSGSKITLFLECANLNAIIQIISRISKRVWRYL